MQRVATRRRNALRSLQRSYHEARYRRRTGARSPTWHGPEDEVVIWLDTFDVAAIEQISPWDALLLAVNRRAARVRWVDAVLQSILSAHRDECQRVLASDPTAEVNPDVPPEQARVWLAESRNEERLLTRAAKMAVDAGVADAVVRRLELEGRLATDALVAGLDALALTPDQRLQALSSMQRALTAAPADVTHDPRVPGYVYDADVVEEDPPASAAG